MVPDPKSLSLLRQLQEIAMTLSFTPFADGDVVEASEVRSKIGTIENFVNTGIGVGELQSTPFLRTRHLFKPDFYGSPAPRTRAVTAETHYRLDGMTRMDRAVFHPAIVDKWIAIRGMGATIKVQQECRVSVYANCYVYEVGGHCGSGSFESNDEEVARIALFVGTDEKAGTSRSIYPSTTDTGGGSDVQYPWARKNHSWATHLTDTLGAGIHNIGFKIYMYHRAAARVGDSDGTRAKHIFIRERSFVVDLFMR